MFKKINKPIHKMDLDKAILYIVGIAFLLIFTSACQQEQNKLTRGVGVYPGNPAEDFSPTLVANVDEYHNLAKLRAAYHSSSYDYNLTAQLVTDGIITNKMPTFVTLSSNSGELPKNEREWLLDNVTGSAVTIEGNEIWLQLEVGGETWIPEVDKIEVNGQFTYDKRKSTKWNFKVSGSDDGINWNKLASDKGSSLPGIEKANLFAAMMKKRQEDAKKKGITNSFAFPFRPLADSTIPEPSFKFRFRESQDTRVIRQSFDLDEPTSYKYYRVSLNAPSAKNWSIGDFDFFSNDTKLKMLPSNYFSSTWMSAGTGKEWVYIDLGVPSTFDKIKLHWVKKANQGVIQVSKDAITWNDVAVLPGTKNLIDDIKLNDEVKGRYVRVLMTSSELDTKYVLSEMEVFGKGGLVPKSIVGPKITENRIDLIGGNWKIQRASEVTRTGETISQSGFETDNWLTATVPATVLVSYWNAGALPDPNFGDNQLMISESFFNSDFWYRDEFEIPSDFPNEKVFLNFDGINWKANIFVNGKKAGRIEGAFTRGIFDVTDFIIPGEKNALAVMIIKNDNIGAIKEQTALSPDKNGGILGGDNPTFHASVGWDWIPTIRGRNIGIWNDVFITTTGSVTIEDPFVVTDLQLPDTTATDINIEVTLQNHKNETVTGTFSGSYGEIKFEHNVSLEPNESKIVKLNSSTHPSLHFENPKLWWPKGYGAPNLYDVELIFKTDEGIVSDKSEFKSGVREVTFDENDQILSLYINGRRFIGRGGNWGFSESNLNYRAREYDIAVAYHADMNFTMIRNWVGQIGDDELYEACDRYGIMIWQDFWLANPVDGPNPYDPGMFMDNAKDMVKRVRNHPSIAIYVGRNEGNPPEVLDTALRAMIPETHHGIHYISHSSTGVVSGGGPYNALPARDYFLLYGHNKLHSERGMPNVMTYESLQQMLPDSALWPQNSQWGLHDYCLQGAQRAASFNEIIEKSFGEINNAKKFTELAQWINYDGYRAMFEGRGEYRKGLLLWMSHSAWPSMVWQTYDYYFEPTAAYFACKKASEPIHIQWNPVYDEIEVVNYNGRNRTGLIAKTQVINMDGSVKWEKEKVIDSNEDTTEILFKMEYPDSLSSVYFIKLSLKDGDQIISENFYWRGIEDGNYQALNDLPVADLKSTTSVKKAGDNWILTTKLKNTSEHPLLMVRLKVIGEDEKERILPVFYSDNYISLMPGEEKIITMELENADTRGEKPIVEISGFNVKD